MSKKDLLTAFGLHEKESRIYRALIEYGLQNVTDIAKHTGLYRTDIYTYLNTLISRGLASSRLKGKRRLYSAESPHKLSILFEEFSASFEDLVPELEKKYTSRSPSVRIHAYEGKAGIRSVYDDIVATLPKGGTFYRYSSSQTARARNTYVSKAYTKLRDGKRLERYVITNAATKSHKKLKIDRYIKIVPAHYDLFEYNVTQLIYGNKIAFVDYNSETATVIENAKVAEFQKKIFTLLFNKL